MLSTGFNDNLSEWDFSTSQKCVAKQQQTAELGLLCAERQVSWIAGTQTESAPWMAPGSKKEPEQMSKSWYNVFDIYLNQAGKPA